jgi:hypothetical protein
MIEDKLRNYKENVARLQLNLLNLDNIDRELIEELCLPASIITDMPRNFSNAFHSKTEDAVLHREFFKNATYDELMKQSREICKIETVLKTLSKSDMLLVELKYFENETWGNIANRYAREIGVSYVDKKTLVRKKKRILLKLETLLGVCS